MESSNAGDRGLLTSEEAEEYASFRDIVPGTILWSADVELTEDAFRSGSRSAAAVDYLRFQDIDIDDREGRVPEEELDRRTVSPGQGISMFIKKIIPRSMTWIGPGPLTGARKKKLRADFSALREQNWWQLEKGQNLPTGLVLEYDGVPPGHCVLTVEREMTVRGFLSLVGMLRFAFAGSDLFGVGIGGQR